MFQQKNKKNKIKLPQTQSHIVIKHTFTFRQSNKNKSEARLNVTQKHIQNHFIFRCEQFDLLLDNSKLYMSSDETDLTVRVEAAKET